VVKRALSSAHLGGNVEHSRIEARLWPTLRRSRQRETARLVLQMDAAISAFGARRSKVVRERADSTQPLTEDPNVPTSFHAGRTLPNADRLGIKIADLP
jgi:hypothetical protein